MVLFIISLVGQFGFYGMLLGGVCFVFCFFIEYGYIIGVVWIWVEMVYQQGLDKYWFRLLWFDFYWFSFVYLGEQVVYFKEIYCIGMLVDEIVFGYQEWYGEYWFCNLMVIGWMCFNVIQLLDIWYLVYDFDEWLILFEFFIFE